MKTCEVDLLSSTALFSLSIVVLPVRSGNPLPQGGLKAVVELVVPGHAIFDQSVYYPRSPSGGQVHLMEQPTLGGTMSCESLYIVM